MSQIQRTQSQKYALVTGASGGIGLELARVLAREGYSLVLVARRAAEMEKLASELKQAHQTESVVLSADLATHEGTDAVARAVTERGLEVDVLVNNAGYGLAGRFEVLPADSQLGMIDLNIRALTALTRAFLPGMVARKRGRVLNVASSAAFQPGPMMAVYYATKAYVLSFSTAINEELRGTGVTATALCPGYTETGFAARAAEHQRPRLFSGPLGKLDARQVAEAGYRAMVRGKPVLVPGFMNLLGAWSAPFTPRPLLLRIVRRLNEAG